MSGLRLYRCVVRQEATVAVLAESEEAARAVLRREPVLEGASLGIAIREVMHPDEAADIWYDEVWGPQDEALTVAEAWQSVGTLRTVRP